MRPSTPAALAFALLALPCAAAAAPEVALRPHPVAHGAVVTLSDVFEGLRGPAAATAVARAAPAGSDTVLDAADVQTKVRVAGYEWANLEGAARIVVGGPQAPPPRAAARPAAARRPSVLVYARNLRAGEVIRAEDLRWSAEAVAGPDGVTQPDLAVGKAARRPLREGAASVEADLAAPVLIHRDDVVSVSFTAEGISLVLQAKALSDASRGQSVEVVNTISKKVIEAVCSGADQAAVGPAADQLKASVQNPAPYATAAR